MVAYFRPLLHAAAWQMAIWLAALACSLRAWPEGAPGVFWGGLVVAANFWAMRFAAHLWYRNRGMGPGLALLLGSKMLLSLAALAGVMHWAKPDPLGLVLGLATFFVGALGASLQRPAPTLLRRR